MTAVMTKVISNRARPRQELRDGIYAAAIQRFRARGYAAATVDEIVAAAGVAKGTFFNFFPTKAHVLKAYYAEIDVEIAGLRRNLDPDDPQGSLKRYGCAVERILRREGGLMLDLLDATISDPMMKAIDDDSGGVDAEEFTEFFRNAVQNGRVREGVSSSAAAASLMDLWTGAVRAWMRDTEKQSLAKLFEMRVAMLFEGIGT